MTRVWLDGQDVSNELLDLEIDVDAVDDRVDRVPDLVPPASVRGGRDRDHDADMKRTLSLLFALTLLLGPGGRRPSATRLRAQRRLRRTVARSAAVPRSGALSEAEAPPSGAPPAEAARSAALRGGIFDGRSAPSYSAPTSSSGSFGRSGSFGNSGRVNSTSLNPSRGYSGRPYGGTSYRSYGNRPSTTAVRAVLRRAAASGRAMRSAPSRLESVVRLHPVLPRPSTYSPSRSTRTACTTAGGFSFTRFILGIVVIGFIVWLVLVRLLGGGEQGGGKRYRTRNN